MRTTNHFKPKFQFTYSLLAVGVIVIMMALFASTANGTMSGQVGSLSGQVIDEKGRAVTNARVSLPEHRLVTHVNNEGFYQFHKLPTAKTRVHVEAKGFVKQSTMVVIQPNATAIADFRLKN